MCAPTVVGEYEQKSSMLIVQYKQGSDLKKTFKKVLTFSYLGCIIVTYSDEQPQNELRTEESLENIENNNH
ncbi:MAG: hypothetical protein UCN61_00660, partial [Ruminococcus sp.]|nr:hypothetical protein [Ruminococcus sp.]